MEFNDIIKVAYNWIGPRGPIWNTELPHILSFAGVGEFTRVEGTGHWWAEDLWHKLFRDRKEGYIVYPAFALDHDDIFIYPFSLAWRVYFNHYFMPNNGILEYGHVINSIKHLVRMHKGFFLFDDSVEAHTEPSNLKAMHNYFDFLQIPMSKVIFLTGTMNAQALYDEWCDRNAVPNHPRERMNIITYPSSMNVYHKNVMQGGREPHTEPNYDPNHMPQKLFLSWNRRHRQHRIILAVACDKAGLVDRSYWSMTYDDPESPNVKLRDSIDHIGNLYFGFDETDTEKYLQKLPLVIDGLKENTEMCDDRGDKARQYYQNSLISLVTETNWDRPEVTLTEKSFKPAKEKHPYIIVGAQHSLKAMRELGFKTFSEFWDESYDDIPNHRERLLAVIKLCKTIGSWDQNQIRDFRHRVKPLLEHNYNLLKTEPAERIATKIAEAIHRTLAL